MQAPIICQICSDGFVTTRGSWKHAAKENHSRVESSKRFIFEVQQFKAVPLQPTEKRRLVGHTTFCTRILSGTRYSQINAL